MRLNGELKTAPLSSEVNGSQVRDRLLATTSVSLT